MEVGKEFKNLQIYNQNMAKGLEDKMFFLEHLPHDDRYVFVDFGCADGTLIDALHQSLPPYNQYIGFDISQQMIELARTKISGSPANVIFTSDWDTVCYEMHCACQGNSKKKVLILSSVVHEVYSYAKNPGDIVTFWKRLLNTGFDYICIRDMMMSTDTREVPTPENWVKNIHLYYSHTIKNERFHQFIKKWGPIENKHNAIHFLLKYRWQINWEREVNEDYFPIDLEVFLNKFEKSYNLDYLQRFTVPFIKKTIEKDFRITLEDTDFTHIKVIFSKKTNK